MKDLDNTTYHVNKDNGMTSTVRPGYVNDKDNGQSQTSLCD